MLKKLIKIMGLALLIIGSVSCGKEATIIDLYHPDTEKLKIAEDVFSNPAYEPFRAEGVLFTPYMVQNPAGTGDETFYKYSLYLGAYKLGEDIDSVTVKHVKVVGTKEADFAKLNQDISLPIEFSSDSIQKSDMILFDDINDQDMKLTKKSEVTVVITVSVVKDGETITKDLTYDFKTRSRTYQVQR
ncbi:hypothetical protein [Neobacillus dielmonensis]|uniref:hypothetical protein n=1 Tax=Neobacillus dielmonensis TaxID=1347369 RepID=UPI0005AB47EE|nr:hypothetical protein [Neobacillus dielmonensis]